MDRRIAAPDHWPDHANHEISYSVQVTETRAISEVYMVGGNFNHVSGYDVIGADEESDGDPFCENCNEYLPWEGSGQEENDLS